MASRRRKKEKAPTFPQPDEVRVAEMPEEMLQAAFQTAHAAMEEEKIEKDMATKVKQHFDSTFGGTWHCIIGRNFGCSLTHDTRNLVFFKYGDRNVLLFKSYE